ncbi:hypothetical protein BU52_05965 [Streptomyces toyocaensis]|uniref:DUF3592 domain-containing protein n=1 Tax=Streptomyces toyocaensis TaxID=55952 RepID=A0A081XWP9_STRTO|nr:DUF3592 domain-containing protein [Streptomyces toyocaensis]KES07972.1 hypothetical protein BU52_05965 [Streptomyces toyocaensis]
MDSSQAQTYPPVPQPRVIIGVLGGALLCAGLALAFWLPSRSLVHDLRDNGVTVAARVTEADSKPKYVKVQFLQGDRSETQEKLWDYAGMLPDVQPGDTLLVTYDPDDPHRSLPHAWVTDPPANLPAYGSTAIAVFLLTGAVVGMVRRRRLLRDPPTRSSPPAPA